MKIKWGMNIGLAGCRREGELDLEDDLTDEEIWEEVKDAVNEYLDYYWERVE